MKYMDKKKDTIISIHEGVKGNFEIIDHCLIVKLEEDLDHHNCINVREEADKIIMRRNIKHIIFDFSATNFMDSSGVGVIMGRYKKVIFIGGSVFATGIGPNIDRIFKLSGLYKIIQKCDTIQDALDLIKEKKN